MRYEDLVKFYNGQRFGELTIILVFKDKRGNIYAKCRCSCGNIKDILLSNLKTGTTKTCGCSFRKIRKIIRDDLVTNRVGLVYGNLTVIESIGYVKNKRGVIWRCQCTCGNYIDVISSNLESGHVTSCGCIQKLNREKFLFNIGCTSGTILTKLNSKVYRNNTSGVKGVSFDKRRYKWKAYITYKGNTYSLGRFDTKEEAVAIRYSAEKNIWNAAEEDAKAFIQNIKCK